MNRFEDPFHGRKGVFQFTMSHLEQGTLFRKEADYTFGINSLAVGTLIFDIRILAYTLMSNHFHLLLYGTYKECLRLWRWLIRRLSRMLGREYGIIGLLHDEDCNVSPVTDLPMFLNELAYILRNCYRARISSPNCYPWSSADVYFNPYRDWVRGTPLREMSQKMQRKILKSHIVPPSGWEIVNGRILNRYFVDYQLVEQKAGSSPALFDKLRLYDLESSVRLSHGLQETLRFSDAQLQEKITVICRNEYHVESPHQLDRKGLLLLARALSRRFAATKGQLRRLLGLTDDVLDHLL